MLFSLVLGCEKDNGSPGDGLSKGTCTEDEQLCESDGTCSSK